MQTNHFARFHLEFADDSFACKYRQKRLLREGNLHIKEIDVGPSGSAREKSYFFSQFGGLTFK